MTIDDGPPVGYATYAEPAEPTSTTGSPARGVLVLLGIAGGAGVVLGVVAGWLWVSLSDPPRIRLAADGGAYLGEVALNQQAGITMWFLAIGVVLGLVAGALVGWFGQRFGWLAVLAVLVLCTVATLESRYLGVHVFGADAASEVASAHPGDLIRLGVKLDTLVGYLGWPIGGLLGALGAIAFWGRVESPRDLPPPSPTIASS